MGAGANVLLHLAVSNLIACDKFCSDVLLINVGNTWKALLSTRDLFNSITLEGA